jgi:hypothetical protein
VEEGIQEEGVGATAGLREEVPLRTVAAAVNSAGAAASAVALQETSAEAVRIRNR